jgi:hypothetical protein
MHKLILKDFCQYQGILIGIFLIPLILLNILIPPIQLTTQTIEYNMCPIDLPPLLCSHQCNNIFVAKISYLLPLINDRYMVGYMTKYGKRKFFAFHWYVEEFACTSLQLCNAWTTNDLLTCPFGSYTHLHTLQKHLQSVVCW